MRKYKDIISMIAGVIIIFLVAFGSFYFGLKTINKNISQQFGSVGEEDYKRLTSGSNQIVSYGPAILHSIVFGTANDSALIGDVRYTAGAVATSNSVFSITATVPSVFSVETIFPQGIMATVTSANGATFISSPR